MCCAACGAVLQSMHKTVLTTTGRAQSIPTYNVQPYTYRWRATQTATGAWAEALVPDVDGDDDDRDGTRDLAGPYPTSGLDAPPRYGFAAGAAPSSSSSGRAGPPGPTVDGHAGAGVGARPHAFSSPAVARTAGRVATSLGGNSADGTSFFTVDQLPQALHELTRTHSTQLDTERNSRALAALDREFEMIRASYPVARTRPVTHSPERPAGTSARRAFEHTHPSVTGGASAGSQTLNSAGTGPAPTAADVDHAPYAHVRASLRQETGWAADRSRADDDPKVEVGLAGAGPRNAPFGVLQPAHFEDSVAAQSLRVINGPGSSPSKRPASATATAAQGTRSAQSSPHKPQSRPLSASQGTVRTTAKTAAIAAANKQRAGSATAANGNGKPPTASKAKARRSLSAGPRPTDAQAAAAAAEETAGTPTTASASGGVAAGLPPGMRERMAHRTALLTQRRAALDAAAKQQARAARAHVKQTRAAAYERAKTGDDRVRLTGASSASLNSMATTAVVPPTTTVRPASSCGSQASAMAVPRPSAPTPKRQLERMQQQQQQQTRVRDDDEVKRADDDGNDDGDDERALPHGDDGDDEDAPQPLSNPPQPTAQRAGPTGASADPNGADTAASDAAAAGAGAPDLTADENKPYLWAERGARAHAWSGGSGEAAAARVLVPSDAAKARARAKVSAFKAQAQAQQAHAHSAAPDLSSRVYRQPVPLGQPGTPRVAGRGVVPARSRSLSPPPRRVAPAVPLLTSPQAQHQSQSQQQLVPAADASGAVDLGDERVAGMIRELQAIQRALHDTQLLSQSTPARGRRGGGGGVILRAASPSDPMSPATRGGRYSGSSRYQTVGEAQDAARAQQLRNTDLLLARAKAHYDSQVAAKSAARAHQAREEAMLDAVYWRYQRDVLGERGVAAWERELVKTQARRQVLAADFAKALHEYRLHQAHFHQHHLLPHPVAAAAAPAPKSATKTKPSAGAAAGAAGAATALFQVAPRAPAATPAAAGDVSYAASAVDAKHSHSHSHAADVAAAAAPTSVSVNESSFLSFAPPAAGATGADPDPSASFNASAVLASPPRA